MHGDKRAYSKEDRNMGLISKVTRSDADIIYMTKEGSARHIYDTMIVNHSRFTITSCGIVKLKHVVFIGMSIYVLFNVQYNLSVIHFLQFHCLLFYCITYCFIALLIVR
jgi:NADH:ubiquinone oxidoreductase subunit K